MDTYLTVAQVAAHIGVHRQTAYRLIWAGDLPFIDIGTGRRARIRVRATACERYMADREKGGGKRDAPRRR